MSRVARKVGHVAAAVGVAMVSRPLLVAAGLGFLAHQALTHERRATEREDEEDDGEFQEMEDNPANVYNPD